jgi:hypothetical protein
VTVPITFLYKTLPLPATHAVARVKLIRYSISSVVLVCSVSVLSTRGRGLAAAPIHLRLVDASNVTCADRGSPITSLDIDASLTTVLTFNYQPTDFAM